MLVMRKAETFHLTEFEIRSSPKLQAIMSTWLALMTQNAASLQIYVDINVLSNIMLHP